MTVFTEHLVEFNRDLWMAMAGHPVALGQADGTLAEGAVEGRTVLYAAERVYLDTWPRRACRPSLVTGGGSRPTPTPSSPGWSPGARPCWTGRPTVYQRPAGPAASAPS